jgi:hypothetical protein
MEGNEKGVDGKRWRRFNESYLKVFLNGRSDDLRRLRRGEIPLQTFHFNSPKLREFGGGMESWRVIIFDYNNHSQVLSFPI